MKPNINENMDIISILMFLSLKGTMNTVELLFSVSFEVFLKLNTFTTPCPRWCVLYVARRSILTR